MVPRNSCIHVLGAVLLRRLCLSAASMACLGWTQQLPLSLRKYQDVCFSWRGGGGLDIVEMKSSQYFFRTEFVSLLVGWRSKPIGRRTYSSVLLMKTQHFEPQVKTHAK